jgi:hypothetical protein
VGGGKFDISTVWRLLAGGPHLFRRGDRVPRSGQIRLGAGTRNDGFSTLGGSRTAPTRTGDPEPPQTVTVTKPRTPIWLRSQHVGRRITLSEVGGGPRTAPDRRRRWRSARVPATAASSPLTCGRRYAPRPRRRRNQPPSNRRTHAIWRLSMNGSSRRPAARIHIGTPSIRRLTPGNALCIFTQRAVIGTEL